MRPLHSVTAFVPALALLGMLISCELTASLFSSDGSSATGGGASCSTNHDCPQDMSCTGGRCRFGGRAGDAGHENSRRAGGEEGVERDAGEATADADHKDHSGGPDRPGDIGGDDDPGCVSPSCAELGRQCGTWADPCGGTITCDGCGPHESCGEEGLCRCLFLECGSGCCSAGEVCHAGACCAPTCVGACCGDDECGGVCADRCAATEQTCNTDRCACEGVCQPVSCSDLGKACGTWADGCGGEVTCGSCGTNQRCSAAGGCECRYQSCGGACCGAEELCHESACCTPSCEGRLCGSDGCGGACGSCGPDAECTFDGTCQALVCEDDPHEPNDSAADAQEIDALPLELNDLWLCDPGQDWWRYEVTEAGEALQVKILFSHAHADLDLFITDASATTIASSQSLSDDEIVLLYDLAAGEYHIQVLSFDHRDAGYDLRVGRPDPCADDGYEPNQDMLHATALGSAPLSQADLRLCATNGDWYRFAVEAGDSVEIKLLNNTPAQQIHFSAYEQSSGRFLTSSHASVVPLSSRLYNLAAGEIALEVAGINSHNVDYELAVDEIDPCPNDGQEPNDTPETAVPIGAGAGALPVSLTALTLCLPEEDWYVFTAGDNEPFSVTLGGTGGLQAEVLDETQSYLSWVNTGGSVEIHGQPAGDYFVKVHSYDSDYRGYDLAIDVAPDCAPDRHEPNDLEAEAEVPTLPLVDNGLTICNPDRDLFKIVATSGQVLTVEVAFSQTIGRLIAGLRSADQTWGTSSYPVDIGEQLQVELEAGEYFLEVYAPSGATNRYALYIDLD